MIRCDKCGAPYKRKHANAGGKYEKIVWICSTFDTLVKAECDSQQIPEDILNAKTTEFGGLDCVSEIRVPDKYQLEFVIRNGIVREAAWVHPSRRQSWTPEMREAAWQIALERSKKRNEA